MLRLFSFRGHTNRLGYLVGVFLPMAAVVFIALLGSLAGARLNLNGAGWSAFSKTMALGLVVVLLWTGLAATVRRLRDIGLSVWLGLMLTVGANSLSGLLLEKIRHLGPATPIWMASAWAICTLACTLAWSLILLWPSAVRPHLDARQVDDVFGPAEPA